MLIIQRHYLKEFLRVLAIVAAGLALIFSLLDLVDKIDDFLPYKPSLKSLALYAYFNFPRYLLYLLPMAILLCSLFTISQADRRFEITAVKAAGGRIKTMLLPFLLAGLFLSFGSFVLGEFIVPEFSKKAHELKNEITKKGKKFSFKEGTMWLRAQDGSIVKIGLYLPERNISRNVSIFKIDKGALKERIEAEEAEWSAPSASGGEGVKDSEGKWKLKNITLYNAEKGSINRFNDLEYPLMEPPAIFAEDIQKPEDLGIRELFRYTKKLENAGFKNLKLLVDFHSKVSYPFVNFVMVLLGISLPLRGKTGKGLVTTAVGIFISLFYWFGHAMSLSVGYAGILPPVIATWLMPLTFGIIAVNLFKGIHE